jgi:hypothetical protein
LYPMSRLRVSRLITALLLVLCLSTGVLARAWYSKQGTIVAKGEAIDVANGGVRIRDTNGRSVWIPIAGLKKEDQQYLSDELKKIDMRLWTHISGKQVLAKHMTVTDGIVFVKKLSSDRGEFDFATLSRADKAWVRKRAAADGQTKQLPEPTPGETITEPQRTWRDASGNAIEGKFDRLLPDGKLLIASGDSTQVTKVDQLSLKDRSYLGKVVKGPELKNLINLPSTHAHAGGPYKVNKGAALTLAGSDRSDVGKSFTLTYSWDLNNDGTFGDVVGQNPSVPWQKLESLGLDSGVHAVKLRVFFEGITSEATSRLTIIDPNAPPVAKAGGPYKITQGSELVLKGHGKARGDHPILTYSWDLDNDGSFTDVQGATPTVTWGTLSSLGVNAIGMHTVKLRVSSGENFTDVSTSFAIVERPIAVPVPNPELDSEPDLIPDLIRVQCDTCGKLAPAGTEIGAPCIYCETGNGGWIHQLSQSTGAYLLYATIFGLGVFILVWMWRTVKV